MSKKRTAKNNSNKGRTWNGFVSVHLTKTDKSNIKDLVKGGGDCLLLVSELLEAGYSLKIAYDAYSDCPTVMLMGGEDAGENNGWAMSCRHADLKTAVYGILYQHTTFADENGSWVKPSDMKDENDW